MNITFLIGNGFDLACGLKTRYVDVYKKYCETESPNENIRNFKKSMLEDKDINWTDFEMALPKWGEKLNNFSNFRECVLDFTSFLDDYLKEQEEMITLEENKAKVAEKIKIDLYQFYQYCLQSSRKTLLDMVKNTSEDVNCRFITFNYTNTLEKCLSTIGGAIKKGAYTAYKYSQPLHIHGVLQNGIILGLDNRELYKDIPCGNMMELKNLIDKVHINNRRSDVTQKALTLLQESRIIVIFGWSMGDSDSYWVNNIKEIFSKNSNVHLVYSPYYSKPANKKIVSEILNREDFQKDFIADKFGIPENQRNRVHIITEHNYLNFEFLTAKDGEESELVTVK